MRTSKGVLGTRGHARLAAENGQLEILKYAHEHGCPWDKATCRLAARERTFGVFEVRARARVSLEREDVRVCRRERTVGVFEVLATRTGVLGTRRRAPGPPCMDSWSV